MQLNGAESQQSTFTRRAGAVSKTAESQEENLPLTGRGKAPVGQNSRPQGPEGRTSSGQSILNLVNCILGAGVLGYPYCFKSCGLLLATCIMLASLAASRFSYQLLLYCSQLSSKRSYEELAEQAVGKTGRQVVELCTAALNLGAIVAYLNILADVISSVAGTLIPPGAEPSRSGYLACVTLLGAVPASLLVRDHAVVAAFSTASVGFIVFFAIVIVCFAVLPTSASLVSGTVTLWRMEGLLVAFPVMAYGFTAHPYYMGIYANMAGASVRKMAEVTDVGMTLTAALYWIVGIGGYLTFKSRTSGDLLRNFGATDVVGLRGAYERAIKLCYGLSILGSIPLVIIPFYNFLLPLLGQAGAPGSFEGGTVVQMTAQKLKHRNSNSGDNLHQLDELAPSSELLDSQSSRLEIQRTLSPRRMSAEGNRVNRTGSKVPTYEMDVVDLKLQQRGGMEGDEEMRPLPLQRHALVVAAVLGIAMASAIWVPNVEFIFGLTGATASVLLSYILPAITFIRLLDAHPEWGVEAPVKAGAEETRSMWTWRKRQAIALLCFGLVSGVLCTDAILNAVQEEAVVVQLAQQIAAREAVVQATTRVQQKAQQAVAAVSVVETASKQLTAAHVNATDTLGQLQQAANALQAIAAINSTSKNMWDIHGLVKERKQHAAESKVLHSVEVTLVGVREGIGKTAESVAAVVRQVDEALALFQAQKEARDEASSAAADAAAADASAKANIDGGNGGTTLTKAADLAGELAKALGVYSNAASTNGTAAGKSLEQVRASAMAALQALNATMFILDKVALAVEAAKRDHKHDQDIKEVAAAAMRMALNATASSALAMQLTTEALQRSANEEASDLLTMLTEVAADAERKRRQRGRSKDSTLFSGSSSAVGSSSVASGAGTTLGFKGRKADTNGAALPDGASGGAVAQGHKGVTSAGPGIRTGLMQSSMGSADQQRFNAAAGSSGESLGAGGSNIAQEAGVLIDGSASGVGGASAVGGTGNTHNGTSSVDAGIKAAAAGQAMAKVIDDLKGLTGKGGVSSSSSSIDSGGSGAKSNTTTIVSKTALTASASAPSSIKTPRLSNEAGLALAKAAVAAAATAAAATLRNGTDFASAGGIRAGASVGGSSETNAAAGGGLSHVNLSAVAAVLKDAAALTADSQQEAVQELQQTLGSADKRVAERVVGIAKEIADSKAKIKGALLNSTVLIAEVARLAASGQLLQSSPTLSNNSISGSSIKATAVGGSNAAASSSGLAAGASADASAGVAADGGGTNRKFAQEGPSASSTGLTAATGDSAVAQGSGTVSVEAFQETAAAGTGSAREVLVASHADAAGIAEDAAAENHPSMDENQVGAASVAVGQAGEDALFVGSGKTVESAAGSSSNRVHYDSAVVRGASEGVTLDASGRMLVQQPEQSPGLAKTSATTGQQQQLQQKQQLLGQHKRLRRTVHEGSNVGSREQQQHDVVTGGVVAGMRRDSRQGRDQEDSKVRRRQEEGLHVDQQGRRGGGSGSKGPDTTDS